MDMNRPTRSIWMATHEIKGRPPLKEDVACDVAIIGAGIAGISTAYMLCKQGKKVIVVDDGVVAGGQTQRTTAHISNLLDRRYSELEKLHGEKKSKLIYQSLTDAKSMISAIIKDERIDCDYQDVSGYLCLGRGQEEKMLDMEIEAMKRAGFNSVSLLRHPPNYRSQTYCLHIRDQAQFHVLRYLDGMLRAIEKMGGRFFCETHIDQIVDGLPLEIITTDGCKIHSQDLVVATNSPISNLVAIHTKQTAYRSYAIAVQAMDELSPDLYWDTEDPYHYARLYSDKNRSWMIIGGADHKTGQDTDFEGKFRELEQWSRAFLRGVGPTQYRWSGQLYEPIDGVAYIGKAPGHSDNVYMATGFSGVGMTQGMLAGMLIADYIAGIPNPYMDVYEPGRISVKSGPEYLLENLNTAAQYGAHLQGSSATLQSIAPGEGDIVVDNGKKIAAYKDEAGNIFQCSAVCPHLKGIVTWNSCEKSWDCPAHGSRFDARGQVIDGPANKDLDTIEAASAADQNTIVTPSITFDQPQSAS